MVTGAEKAASCHPLPDSPANVTVANRWPDADHSVPVWGPVLPLVLKNRMPKIWPGTSELNLTPNSTAEASVVCGPVTDWAKIDVHVMPCGHAVEGAPSATTPLRFAL